MPVLPSLVAAVVLAGCAGQPLETPATREWSPEIRLRNRSFIPSAFVADFPAGRHVIVQVEGNPDAAATIERWGGVIEGYVPDDAFAAYLPFDSSTLAKIAGVRWADELELRDKIAADLVPDLDAPGLAEDQEPVDVVVRLHGGVDVDAFLGGLPAALAGQRTRYLPPSTFWLRATLQAVIELAREHPEVIWIQRAAPVVTSGRAFGFCLGPMTPFGPVMAYASPLLFKRIADVEPTSIPYHLVNITPDGDCSPQDVIDGMALWNDAVLLDWDPTHAEGDPGQVDISFVYESHGDFKPFPVFNGPLAHAFKPDAPEPWNRDVHVNEAHIFYGKAQAAGPDYHLRTVIAHEIGHALGLGHLTAPAALMHDYIPADTEIGLDQHDRDAIQLLYAPKP